MDSPDPTRPGSRSSSNDEEASIHPERPGIFGLETELAVVYLPTDESEVDVAPEEIPSFEIQERVLFECLLEGRKAARSAGLKGGYFLENGGQVHMEMFLQRQQDTPILEVATPECRSPWDLMVYSRAYDEILDETSRRTEVAFEALGYHGRLMFGKSNVDSRATGFGSHENYLVHHKPNAAVLWCLFLCSPVVLLTLFPPFVLLLFVLLIGYLGWGIGSLVPPIGRAARRFYHSVILDSSWRLMERGRLLVYLPMILPLYPVVTLYSFLVRHLALRPFLRDLTPFLVTRQILTGSGRLDFEHEVFELSQRANLTRSVAKIVMFGKQKTMYDLKGLLYDPRDLFRRHKRLAITLGDSNLSDVPNGLKLGTTALIIEMIEAGEFFKDLGVRRPVRVFREVSRAGPWKEIRLRSGRKMTALALQREYLERAKSFFRDHPDPQRKNLLAMWEDTIQSLNRRPQALADTLDWTAKKSLLDRAVLESTNWKLFFAWGKLFFRAGLKATRDATSLADLVQRAPIHRRFRLPHLIARRGLEETDFTRMRKLFFQVSKIDLRYHELGAGSGYQRQLEAAGMIQRLTADTPVAKAIRQPPPNTRARVRSFYINLGSGPDSIRANWDEVELRSPPRHIPLPDPFYYRIPTDP